MSWLKLPEKVKKKAVKMLKLDKKPRADRSRRYKIRLTLISESKKGKQHAAKKKKLVKPSAADNEECVCLVYGKFEDNWIQYQGCSSQTVQITVIPMCAINVKKTNYLFKKYFNL